MTVACLSTTRPGVWGTSNKTTNPHRKFNASKTRHAYRTEQHGSGRFLANLVVNDDALNDGRDQKFATSGSYSRYFDLDAWAKTLPFLIVSKANKREKGLENEHPTVKPLVLMSYLITLGSRPGDVVLDPFLGSGTTAIAAKALNRRYIGIEREIEYIRVARARVKATRLQQMRAWHRLRQAAMPIR